MEKSTQYQSLHDEQESIQYYDNENNSNNKVIEDESTSLNRDLPNSSPSSHLISSDTESTVSKVDEKGMPFIYVALVLILIQIGFGGYAIVLKAFAEDVGINPVIIGGLRDICCFPVLYLASRIVEPNAPKPEMSDIKSFLLIGGSGIYMNQLFFILGLYFTSPNTASAFQPTIPVFTSVLAIIFRIEEKPNIKNLVGGSKIFGIFFSTAGAVTIVLSQGLDAHGYDIIFGNIFLLINCLSMAAFFLLQKKLIYVPGGKWSTFPVSTSSWSYLVGSILMSITSLFYVFYDLSVFELPSEIIIPLLYAIFISSAFCYGGLTWANQHVVASITTAFWPFQVVVVVVGSYMFFGEKMNVGQYIGAFLIIVGLLAVCYSNYLRDNVPPISMDNVANSSISPSHSPSLSVSFSPSNDSNSYSQNTKKKT